MSSKAELLDEYCKLHDDINKIKDVLENLQRDAKFKITFADTDEEKDKIIGQFRKDVCVIKKNIVPRYKELRERQDSIKKKLIGPSYTTTTLPKTANSVVSKAPKRVEKDKPTTSTTSLTDSVTSMLNKYRKIVSSSSEPRIKRKGIKKIYKSHHGKVPDKHKQLAAAQLNSQRYKLSKLLDYLTLVK